MKPLNKNDKTTTHKIVTAKNEEVIAIAKKGMEKYKKALERLSKN